MLGPARLALGSRSVLLGWRSAHARPCSVVLGSRSRPLGSCSVLLVLELACGPPCSGKSTWCSLAACGDVVTADDVRLLGAQGAVALARAEQAAAELLAGGRSVTVDACSLGAVRRSAWRELAAEHGVPTRLIVFDVNPREAARRNGRRPRHERVPWQLLTRCLASWPDVRAQALGEPWGEVVLASEVRASADEW